MLRNLRTLVLTAAVALTAVAGVTVATPGEAAAADRYQGPTLKSEQGSFNGKNVRLTLTNPNPATVLGSSCTSALLDGTQALQAFVAFNAGDYGTIVKIMLNSGLRFGPAASNNLISPGPNSNSTDVKVGDGVYLFLGTCGGLGTLLDPTDVGVTVRPVIVPSGIGSIGSVLDFGSLAMQSGVGSSDFASILSLLSAS
ncbi:MULTISPECIES: hypothetical protein [Gordonia]|uniref:Secreted protein n=1 Tax=Gordonia sihwensis NBRC 108236 TaxID=1223544 RepID=L7LRA0_9ACTN|nr:MULTISPECIES: hypothetical protein [Gordonia]AUH67804.1 hypothetical protein CXX93_04935 [Gordonia sp. YC-JH1]KXT58235.1 hypothetical protein Y710_03935 [Gordonia sp. QH-12]MBY4568893.1 hypothetical protein [Gordonia sihwensis]GAC62702.1 hypothetical protein GSI01S_41_00020 [Gordonia sihwensis NBRC 108236]